MKIQIQKQKNKTIFTLLVISLIMVGIFSATVVATTAPTLLSLSGTVKYSTGSPVNQGSFRLQIKNPDTGASIWGPYDFNNVIVGGEFGIVLGGAHLLTLPSTPPTDDKYKIEVAFCDLSTFSASCTGSHYAAFTTYFTG